MNGIELKPCPFCGSDDVICGRFEDVYYVECLYCGAKVETYNGLEDAAAGWNARAIDRDKLWEVVESLEMPWPDDKHHSVTIPVEGVEIYERSIAAQIRKAVGE